MEAVDFTSPAHQAKHLARYISDPSTIQAHCVNSWGTSPSLARIKRLQESQRRRSKQVDDPLPQDGHIQRLGILPVAKPKAPERKVEPKRILAPPPKLVWPEKREECFFNLVELIDSVAKDFDISHGELIGTDRRPVYVNARWVVWRILRDRGWSYKRAAHAVNRNDHSTVIHAIENFDIRAKHCPLVGASYEAHRAAGWCK